MLHGSRLGYGFMLVSEFGDRVLYVSVDHREHLPAGLSKYLFCIHHYISCSMSVYAPIIVERKHAAASLL